MKQISELCKSLDEIIFEKFCEFFYFDFKSSKFAKAIFKKFTFYLNAYYLSSSFNFLSCEAKNSHHTLSISLSSFDYLFACSSF